MKKKKKKSEDWKRRRLTIEKDFGVRTNLTTRWHHLLLPVRTEQRTYTHCTQNTKAIHHRPVLLIRTKTDCFGFCFNLRFFRAHQNCPLLSPPSSFFFSSSLLFSSSPFLLFSFSSSLLLSFSPFLLLVWHQVLCVVRVCVKCDGDGVSL